MKKNENIFDRGLIEALGEFASARQEMIHDVEYALKLAGNKKEYDKQINLRKHFYEIMSLKLPNNHELVDGFMSASIDVEAETAKAEYLHGFADAINLLRTLINRDAATEAEEC